MKPDTLITHSTAPPLPAQLVCVPNPGFDAGFNAPAPILGMWQIPNLTITPGGFGINENGMPKHS